MTPERDKKIRQVLDYRQTDLTVIMDRVHKGRNRAAVMRTCDAVGIAEMHVVSSTKEIRPFSGTAKGSDQWVNLMMHATTLDAIDYVKSEGKRVLATSVNQDAKCYSDINYNKPLAIIFGAENTGVSSAAVEAADETIFIPMLGMVESYNVSVAAAIILNEARNQKAKAGHYLQPSLDDESYQAQRFQWGYPKLAKFCDRKGINYPDLDQNGYIDDPEDIFRKQVAQSQGVST